MLRKQGRLDYMLHQRRPAPMLFQLGWMLRKQGRLDYMLPASRTPSSRENPACMLPQYPLRPFPAGPPEECAQSLLHTPACEWTQQKLDLLG